MPPEVAVLSGLACEPTSTNLPAHSTVNIRARPTPIQANLRHAKLYLECGVACKTAAYLSYQMYKKRCFSFNEQCGETADSFYLLMHLFSAPKHQCLVCWSRWPSGRQTPHLFLASRVSNILRPEELHRENSVSVRQHCWQNETESRDQWQCRKVNNGGFQVRRGQQCQHLQGSWHGRPFARKSLIITWASTSVQLSRRHMHI